MLAEKRHVLVFSSSKSEMSQNEGKDRNRFQSSSVEKDDLKCQSLAVHWHVTESRYLFLAVDRRVTSACLLNQQVTEKGHLFGPLT